MRLASLDSHFVLRDAGIITDCTERDIRRLAGVFFYHKGMRSLCPEGVNPFVSTIVVADFVSFAATILFRMSF